MALALMTVVLMDEVLMLVLIEALMEEVLKVLVVRPSSWRMRSMY